MKFLQNKKIVLLVFVSLLLIVIIITQTRTTGSLRLTLNKNGPAKNEIYIDISGDNYYKKFNRLPGRVNLKPGDYTLSAWTRSAAPIVQDFKIIRRQTTNLLLDFASASPNIKPDDDVEEDGYLGLLPHDDNNFEIKAKTKEIGGQTVLVEIIIRPIVGIAPDDTVQSLAAKKVEYINEAKSWLAKQGVPETVPITIESSI